MAMAGLSLNNEISHDFMIILPDALHATATRECFQTFNLDVVCASTVCDGIRFRQKQNKIFDKDDETSANDGAADEDPKRSKVERVSTAASSKDTPKQRKVQSASAASDTLQRFSYASSTEVKRFFLGRHYVKHGMSQADKDAIRNKNKTSRGMGFNEEEKLFMVEEMREMQLSGLDATHIAQVRTIIQKGRQSKFLTETEDGEQTYENKVQRYIKGINGLNPSDEAMAEYMRMKDESSDA